MTSRSVGSTATTSPWLNPKILTLFTLVFVCGLALGMLVTREVMHHRMARANNPPKVGLNELKKQLHLTADQVRVVEHELDDYAKYYQNIEDDRQDVAAHGKTVIERILTPEQRRTFLGILAQPGFPLK